jgi:hypothetical protein
MQKDAYSDGVIGPLLPHFANTQTLFQAWKGSKYFFGTAFGEGA